ncbi:MAG: M24 family metallopeptidase, partial [Kiritimatiellae bacterium]|nr:M24 family metallopeptidase [Kiritimatiellia bacterium]
GMTEWEMRGIMRGLMDEHSQGEAFDSILATGPNSSHCHHLPGARRLGRNDILLADHGCLVQSYRSDMTRVAHTGRPSRKFLEIHRITREAQERAISAIRPGVLCREVDAVARDHIAAAGYGACFGHGLGHGVGMDIHERPSFSTRDETRLEAGHVMTVEPGIYLPDFGGVRIEDMVVVTPKGCDVLTRVTRELIRL